MEVPKDRTIVFWCLHRVPFIFGNHHFLLNATWPVLEPTAWRAWVCSAERPHEGWRQVWVAVKEFRLSFHDMCIWGLGLRFKLAAKGYIGVYSK